MSESEVRTYIFEVKKHGDNFYIKSGANEVYSKMTKGVNFDEYDILIVDFSNIDTVSSGFAFDLFQKFRISLGALFLKKIRVKFDSSSQSELVRAVVKGAIGSQMPKP